MSDDPSMTGSEEAAGPRKYSAEARADRSGYYNSKELIELAKYLGSADLAHGVLEITNKSNILRDEMSELVMHLAKHLCSADLAKGALEIIDRWNARRDELPEVGSSYELPSGFDDLVSVIQYVKAQWELAAVIDQPIIEAGYRMKNTYHEQLERAEEINRYYYAYKDRVRREGIGKNADPSD